MRLLHAVVSPTLLLGRTTIDPTKAVLDKSRHTHNKMMRKLLGLFKRPEQDCQYHERCRGCVEDAMHKAKQEP